MAQMGTEISSPPRTKRRGEYIANRIDDPFYVRILDTTLRDGEQAPGAALTSNQKLEVARQLWRLAVDIIEAGFPAVSQDEMEAVKMIAKEVGNHVDDNDGYVPVIAVTARCTKADIDAAWEAVRHALRPRIQTFIATSDCHLKYKLNKSRKEVICIATQSVAYARSLGCHDIGFVPEDAGSGRHALRSRLLQLGYELNGKQLEDVFLRFKAVADQKKALCDGDLEALITDENFQPQVIWSLVELQVNCGTMGRSTGTVKLVGPDGKEHVACAVGTGPIDAAYKAIDSIIKVPVNLLEYSLQTVTEGIDAIASTRVLIQGEQRRSLTHAITEATVQHSLSGTGAEMDIVVSSASAYISALNKMLAFQVGPMEQISSKTPDVSS